MPFSQLLTSLKQKLYQTKQKYPITSLDITLFLRQFATLQSAGVPIIQSCEMLEKSQEKIALRLLIYSIKREILTGKNLFHSLRQHARYFDELTCQLILIGEHTGKLETMLTTIANHHEKKLAFRKKLKQALFYPCIISFTAFIVTSCLFIFVIPRFAELFHDTQATLPILTVWIFYLSSKLHQYAGFLLLAFFFLAFILFCSRQWEWAHVKHNLQQVATKCPLIHSCLHKIILARFARNLAITFAAGIPITEALKLTANACGNLTFAGVVTQLRSKISAGLQLNRAMEAFPDFPILMIQMVKVGEESGMLEQMLDKMADFLESEIDQFISHLSQLLEPLIMIVLGVLIGGLVIGMYLPIFNLGSTI
jgi:type IV pilus assembly protein PilC